MAPMALIMGFELSFADHRNSIPISSFTCLMRKPLRTDSSRHTVLPSRRTSIGVVARLSSSPPAPRRAAADCGDPGQGGRAAGQAPRRPRQARHPHAVHLPRHVRRPATNRSGGQRATFSESVANFESGKSLRTRKLADHSSRVLKVSAVTCHGAGRMNRKPVPKGYSDASRALCSCRGPLIQSRKHIRLIGAVALSTTRRSISSCLTRSGDSSGCEPRVDPHFVWYASQPPSIFA